MWNVVAKIINARWFLKTPHKTRMWFVGILMTSGFFLISWCAMGTQSPNGLDPNKAYKFWISLFASTMIGVACALGESNVVAFLKRFPSKTVGFWSSGTGLAGLMGTSILLAMNAAGLKDWQIYMFSIPMMIPYMYCCLWLIRKSKLFPFVPEEEVVLKEKNEVNKSGEEQQVTAIESIPEEKGVSDND